MRSQAIYYLNLDAFALGHFLPGVVDGRTFSEEDAPRCRFFEVDPKKLF